MNRDSAAIQVNRLQREVREDGSQVRACAVTGQNRSEQVAIIVDYLQIARSGEQIRRKPGPLSDDSAAPNAATQQEHDAAAAMVGAERRIFLRTAAELGVEGRQPLAAAGAQLIKARVGLEAVSLDLEGWDSQLHARIEPRQLASEASGARSHN